MSRRRYDTDKPHPVPPIHPSCRCVLLPVTELTDLGEDVPRPAANADFDAEAKRMYEEKYPQKRFDNLAPSTREQYRHKAIHEYEERTGKPAFTRAPGSMTFADFFEQSSEQFKKDWLKPGKYALYKSGKYPITAFIPPHPDRAFGVKQLKEMDIDSFRHKVGNDKNKKDAIVKPPKTKDELRKEHLSKRQKQWNEAYDNRRDAWIEEMRATGLDDSVIGVLADMYTPEVAKLGKPPIIKLIPDGVQHYNRSENVIYLLNDMMENDPETLRHEMTHWWHYGIIRKHPEIQNELKKAAKIDYENIKKYYSKSRLDFMISKEKARNKAARSIFHVDQYDSLTEQEQKTVMNFFNSVGSISSGEMGGMHGKTWQTVDDPKENKEYFTKQNQHPWRCNYGEVVAELCERFNDKEDKLRLAFPNIWNIVKKYKEK